MMVLKVTPELEAQVEAMVASGRFPDETAVLSAAMRLLVDRERMDAQLREELRIGEEQMDRGELVSYDENFFPRLLAEAKERSRLGLPVKNAVKPRN
jgi:putative addiction module CopG family antidote